jgi:hypothetical protein
MLATTCIVQERFGIRGLLPARIETIDEQLHRGLFQFRYVSRTRCSLGWLVYHVAVMAVAV